MAKFAMTVWPIDTHLTPFVALARELRARGHAVAFYTGPQAGPQLQRAGFGWFPFKELDSTLAERNPGAQSNLKLGLRATSKMWNDFLLGSLPGQIADLEQMCDTWRPDVLICDMTLWGPILVLHETKRVPIAVLSHTAYCVLPGRENAAPGISLPPPRGAAGRFALRLVARAMNAAGGINRDANRIRAAHGLPPLEVTVTEYTGRMPLYLVPSAPELDYGRRDLPPSVHYVGLCATEDLEAQPAPGWTTRKAGGAPRIVVLEEPHYAEDPWLLRTAAAAMAEASTETILVAGQGRNPAGLELGKLASNVRLEAWTPIEKAIASADVVIAHGNSETVLAALGRGIPMVILPRILEQPQIAWRLAASGAGIRVALKRATSQKLREAAEEVLRTPSFRQNAGRVAEALVRCGGPARAADLVADLVQGLAR
jgi:MGT family glycosyltransferase